MPVRSSLPFGDSWRVRGDCPKTKEKSHPCKVNKHREARSHQACALIKSNKFKSCHQKVDPNPYYDRCVFDTCGCDMVGDCECTCEAIAAYAYECLAGGVMVNWRQGFDKCGRWSILIPILFFYCSVQFCLNCVIIQKLTFLAQGHFKIAIVWSTSQIRSFLI